VSRHAFLSRVSSTPNKTMFFDLSMLLALIEVLGDVLDVDEIC